MNCYYYYYFIRNKISLINFGIFSISLINFVFFFGCFFSDFEFHITYLVCVQQYQKFCYQKQTFQYNLHVPMFKTLGAYNDALMFS